MKNLTLPPLPYDYNALEPVISAKQLEIHHDLHHTGYVNKTNTALEKLENSRQGKSEIDVKAVLKDLSFNLNGAMLHSIFWENMRKPRENNKAEGNILTLIENNFGSFEAFKNEFSKAASSVEGSGWAVLWMDADNNLLVGQLEKHNLLGMNGFAPILVLDVWEHAYYLDYQNKRDQFIDNWWQLVNWDDVSQRSV